MGQTRAKIIAVFAVFTLFLASCGNDDDPVASPPTSDPGSPQTEDPDSDNGDDGSDDDSTAGPVDVVFSEPADALAAALSCPDERQHPDVPGVLLVPGTGLGSEENFSSTLGVALPDAGYDVCTVDLVDQATGDIQRSAEYVAAAIFAMADDGYDEIAVVGFSQGFLASRWALAWWPEARDPVVDLISIAGPSGGASATAPLCLEACAAALHQMSPGSAFLTALNDVWPSVTGFDVTLIGSTSDTVISPEEVAVAGTPTILVQDVCPAREVDHVELVADPVVLALVLDALGNDGAASPDRVDASVCDETEISGGAFDPQATNDGAFGVILGGALVPEEPALAAYVD